MSYLQSRNNLGDVDNLSEARTNLGLGTLASQMHTNVNIANGTANLYSLRVRLPGSIIKPNSVLVASNDIGDVTWSELAVADWLNKPQNEISLASMCNDANFITKTEVDKLLLDIQFDSTDDTTDTINILSTWIMNNQIDINSVTTSYINTASITTDNISLTSANDVSGILFQHQNDAHLSVVPLIQTFSNSDSFKVCSASALNDLYIYVKGLEQYIPDDTAGFMISTNNFLEPGLNSSFAVSNLGLNDSFHTSNLQIKDVIMTKPTYDSTTPFANTNTKTYSLLKEGGTNRLIYKEDKLIHSFLERSQEFPVSAENVNTLYEYVKDRLNQQMLVENVLSEIVENNDDGSENPLRTIFRQRLRTTGIKEVAFTASWNDLSNAPRSLSAFDNMNGNNETLFLYSKSNFNDILDKEGAMINLGISKAGRTGNFEDLILPNILRTLGENDLELSKYPGIPFLSISNNLFELRNTLPMVYSNLGLGDIVTYHRSNISILDGDITVSKLTVKQSLQYLTSNISIDNAFISNDIYLRCTNSDGTSKWDKLPSATTSKPGITMLTNNMFDSDSNVAITPYSLNNFITSNDLFLGPNKKWRLHFDDVEMQVQRYDTNAQDYISVHTFS